MAEWKREIRKLCRDFCLSKEIYNKIIKETDAHIKPYILGL